MKAFFPSRNSLQLPMEEWVQLLHFQLNFFAVFHKGHLGPQWDYLGGVDTYMSYCKLNKN